MTNYNNGKIYKLVPVCEHDEGDIYIGSTTKEYLCQRMTAHKHCYRKWQRDAKKKYSCFDIFDKYGIDNIKIILIELVNANSKDELISKESEHIRNNKCINKVIPNRTKPEYLQKYYQEKKDKINAKTICECGIECNKNKLLRHKKTKKHANRIKNPVV
jgi:hypothetical protein